MDKFSRSIKLAFSWLTCLSLLLSFSSLPAECRIPSTEGDPSGMVIIIFSSEKEVPRTVAAQKTAWSTFVAKLKKLYPGALEVIDEISLDDFSDKARALELARSEKDRYSVWLRFSMTRDQLLGQRGETIDVGRLIANYIVYTPGATKVIGDGMFEQEKVRESDFETYTDSGALRQSGGKLNSTRPPTHRDDMMSGRNSQTLDQNAVKKVGEQVAEKVAFAVKNHEKAKR